MSAHTINGTDAGRQSFRFFRRGSIAIAWLSVMIMTAGPAPAQTQPTGRATHIYFDNDFHGPGESSIQALVPLLAARDVKIVGIGVVTGDAWLDEETQHVLRFLEIAGRTDIPVHRGAEMPLVRTQSEMASWESRFGRIPWKGAWNAPRPNRKRVFHADDPHLIPPSPAGVPTIKAQEEDAPHALIRAVRSNPNQVTVVVAGPLTNIALALRLDPEIASLAREIIIEAFSFDQNAQRVTVNADYATDFNAIFDPEAAHIVLTAPWRRITALGNAAGAVKITPELVARIRASGTPMGRYIGDYARIGLPLWDEMTTAVALDPTLIKREVVGPADVDTAGGLNYGFVRVWNIDDAPDKSRTPVHFVMDIDQARFVDQFIEDVRK